MTPQDVFDDARFVAELRIALAARLYHFGLACLREANRQLALSARASRRALDVAEDVVRHQPSDAAFWHKVRDTIDAERNLDDDATHVEQ